MKHLFTISLILIFSLSGFAQMNINGTIKYGNEWIDYDKTYYKIEISEDGVYRVSYEELIAAGMDANSIVGSDLQMFHFGEEVALKIANNGSWLTGDYFEFYAQKNRAELDKFLYKDWEKELLNPEYSLFNDNAAYFVTINTGVTNKRYTEVLNNLTNLPNVEEYYMHSETTMFTNNFYKPTQSVQFSSFQETEGFGSNFSLTQNFNIATKKIVAGGPNAIFKMRTSSNNPTTGVHKVSVTFNNDAIINDIYSQNILRSYTTSLELDQLDNNNSISLSGQAGSNSQFKIALASITYPRAFDFENSDYWEFELEANFFNRYLEITNFDGGSEAVLFDTHNAEFIKGIEENGILKFKLLPNTSDSKYVLFNPETATKTIPKISKRNYIDYSQVDPSYMILTSQRLDSEVQGENVIQEYAAYRSSEEGGNYDVYIVHQEDIYDQYGYGVDRHNIANRNFSHHQAIIWPNLSYWFVIGKGLEYNLMRNDAQIANNSELYHVSPFGVPGSDMLMLSDLGEANPKYSIGRLAVINHTELREYFEKMKIQNTHHLLPQSVEEKAWTKEIIHLSGGDGGAQQEGIFGHLESMRDIVENSKFGGNVTTYRKYTADAIQTSISQEILTRINKGVSLITFFGHSGVNTFDYSLEAPSQYDNYGKCPLILSLGCLSGNIHTGARGLSEDFVLEPEKGSIAFLASSGTAYIPQQGNSGRQLYTLFGEEAYYGTLGEFVHNIFESNKDNYQAGTRTLMQQLTLHGDPAVRLYPHPGPDYTIDKGSVNTEPSVVSTSLPNFSVNFDVYNIGSSVLDSINVFIQHIAPSGEVVQEKTKRIKAPRNKTSLNVLFDSPNANHIGKNTIEIFVDSDDAIVELPDVAAENNNRLTAITDGIGYCFYVLDSGIVPVYPSEYAIVNNQCPFELKASTNNAFIDEHKYLFQIDTTELFNSSMLNTGEVISKGGLVSWTPSIAKTNNQVYYWRVSPDSTNVEIGYSWTNSSFVYEENGEEGWNQSHYFQYLNNDLNTIKINDKRQWEFGKQIDDLRFDLGSDVQPGLWFYNNGVPFGSLNPKNKGNLFVINVRTPFVGIYQNSGGAYGSVAYSGNIFPYRMDSAEDRKNVAELIESLPEECTVLIYSVILDDTADFHFDEWDNDVAELGYSLYDKLEDYGLTQIRTLKDAGSSPFLFAFHKASKKAIHQELAEQINQTIGVDLFFTEGTATLTSVSKSINWDKIKWQTSNVEDQDSIYLNVYAVDQLGNSILMLEKQTSNEINLSDFNEISINTLKIELVAKDEINRTVPNIDFIKVLYTQAPDVALHTNSDSFVFESDTLDQGADLRLKLPLVNYSKSAIGQSTLRMVLTNESNQEIVKVVEVPSIEGMTEKTIDWSMDTKDMQGRYLWSAEYNSTQNPIEQNYFNNIGVGQFFVAKDVLNPVIDVTFDGVHIANGDLVSSKPEILLTSKDNNKYLILDNPELFELALKYPDGTLWNVPVTDNSIEFYPPTSSDENKATLFFRPDLPQDGIYTLTVQSKDVSGNFSGDNNYTIEFEVKNKKSISNVLNYPNPFSTSTEFVFTVTGDTAPEAMMVNIYTLSGKLVRQIRSDEIGPVHVGHNRSRYKWDGTDEYGQKLANGVYLYRIIYDEATQSTFEAYYTESDSNFKNGFGKMVIMR